MITNNDIMKKLRVALKFRDTDIIEVLKLADFLARRPLLLRLGRRPRPRFRLLLRFRRGRMAHDQPRDTGQGSRQGGERGRGGGDNRGRGSAARGGSRGGRR